MPVVIKSVNKNSPCRGVFHRKIRAGDTLVKIDGHGVEDVLDYRFYMGGGRLALDIVTKSGKARTVKVRKSEDEDLGLRFDTYLMDRQRACRNKCVFCFIDQLPPGLRDSLYFKDDDSRLSFLFGNYITLTNLTRREVDRIIEMRISPVNVSVHTTNPELRAAMMRNKRAGECLGHLRAFADAGIALNAQLVLCPGLNDGDELRRSLRELTELYPALKSVAAVPVGLTAHRGGLPALTGYTKEKAAEVIDIIDGFNAANDAKNIPRLLFAADEFYILAGREMPCADFYGDFPQLENGVGMWALFREEFASAIARSEVLARAVLPDSGHESTTERRVTIATGEAAYPLMRELAAMAQTAARDAAKKISVNVAAVKNKFFGGRITVAGLLTGRDFAEQLKGLDLGDELLIPASSLRREGDLFLDGMSPDELSRTLGVPVRAVRNDGTELLDRILGAD